MIRALLWKEWREQRWRCLLGVVVMATLAGSLMRAQIVPAAESVILVFGPIGLLLTVFMAMGNVAAERDAGTWRFLLAQPVARANLLRAKWLVGAAFVASMYLIGGAAAHVAAESRGIFDLPQVPNVGAKTMETIVGGNSAAWLWNVVASAGVSMLAWYTALFFVLTRARNELHAGLGGLLLSIALLVWALQYLGSQASELGSNVRGLFWYMSMLNPAAPLLAIAEPAVVRLAVFEIAIGVWIIFPVWVIGRRPFERSRA